MTGGMLEPMLSAVKARATCPVCQRGTRVSQDGPEKWYGHRAFFSCGAVFAVQGNEIVSSRACNDRTRLAAELWTKEVVSGEVATGAVELPADVGSVFAEKTFEAALAYSSALMAFRPDDHDAALTALATEIGTVARAGGYDLMTVCELIRDEMDASRPALQAPQHEGSRPVVPSPQDGEPQA